MADLKEQVVNQINEEPLLKIEYFDIVDASTLQTITHWDECQCVTGCITVYCGDVRLIDNVQYKRDFFAIS